MNKNGLMVLFVFTIMLSVAVAGYHTRKIPYSDEKTNAEFTEKECEKMAEKIQENMGAAEADDAFVYVQTKYDYQFDKLNEDWNMPIDYFLKKNTVNYFFIFIFAEDAGKYDMSNLFDGMNEQLSGEVEIYRTKNIKETKEYVNKSAPLGKDFYTAHEEECVGFSLINDGQYKMIKN